MALEVLTARSSRIRSSRRLSRHPHRVEAREFLAEGPNAIREALAVPECVREVYAARDAMERWPEISARAAAAGVPVRICDDAAIAALADSITPQGFVARCGFLDVTLDAIVADDPALVVVAADMRDPGNAGSLLRCADAVAADALVFAGSSVDPYNGKVVRASVGSLFHTPFACVDEWEAALEALRAAGLTALGADGSAAVTLDDVAARGVLSGSVSWVFGNEAHGLSDEQREHCDELVAVPIYGRAESLNVATAAAVCLYRTVSEQRTAGGGRSLPPAEPVVAT